MTRHADPDPHQPLRDDVRLLGELLGRVLRGHEGSELFTLVENVRALSKRAHGGGDADVDRLAEFLRQLPIGLALPVARAFSHFLSLANIAEQHHRARRRRDHARGPGGRPQRGSSLEALARLSCGDRSRSATRTSIRTTSSRSSCSAGCEAPGRTISCGTRSSSP